MIFVTVIEPRNREIYANGVYDDPLGPTPTLITLNAGSHIFETLTSGPGPRLVDYTGNVDNVPELGSATIDLQPVVPPKPKGT
jgi:hypothetical protein